MINLQRIQELLGTVPKPPEDALPQGVEDGECAGFENRTGITLPDDIRDWLKMANGPCVGPGGLYGIRPPRTHLDIEPFFLLFPKWKARKWIPIAGDGCGNYYIVPSQHEFGPGFPVLFIDTNVSVDEPCFIVASDIGHFLVSILEKELGKEGWPFNEMAVVQSDPGILSFKDVDLPWAAK